MDFSLSEEQKLLSETVGKFVTDELSFEKRQKALKDESSGLNSMTSSLIELGLAGLMISQDQGGFGGNSFDMMLVAEELGKGLVPAPILPIAALSAPLVASDEAVLAEIAEEKIIMPALHERGLRYELEHFSCKFSGGNVSGEKTLVPGAAFADGFLVATNAGIVHVPNGRGVSITAYALQDGSPSGDVTFNEAEGRLLEGADLAAAVDIYCAATCAYTAGAMQKAAEITREYLQVRKQFGRPLASFQTLSFRMVDLFTAVDEAKSMAIHAAEGANLAVASARSKAVSAAKVKIGRLASYVGEDSVQMHGGVGVAIEYSIGWYLKYFSTFNLTFGDIEYHLKRYTGSIDWQ